MQDRCCLGTAEADQDMFCIEQLCAAQAHSSTAALLLLTAMGRLLLTRPLLFVPCSLCVQLQRGFVGSDSVLHTDLLTDRLATEDYQRYRSATVLLFLGDEPTASSSSSSSKNWSLVFPLARGGAWRGSAVPFEYKAIREQGKQVRVVIPSSPSTVSCQA